MSGKIFNASASIYQDQAKVLFAYYKQAAEKIVSEEVKYEKEIAVCKERVAQLSQDFTKAKHTRLICMIFFFLLIPIYFAITAHLKMKELQADIDANEQKIGEFQKMHKEIFRDYKVTKLGIGYVPMQHKFPLRTKVLLLITPTLSILRTLI